MRIRTTGIFKRTLSYFFCLTLIISCVIPTFADVTGEIPLKPASVFYVDETGTLSDETLSAIKTANSSVDGEIYVVVVETTGTTDIDDFAHEIYQAWEIGDSEENGILFLISLGIDDNTGATYYSLVGAGMSQGFDNGVLENILDINIEPYFDTADYNSSAQIFISDCLEVIENAATSEESSTTQSGTVSQSEEESEISFISNFWRIIKTILIIMLIVLTLTLAFLIFLNLRAKKVKEERKKRSNSGRKINHSNERQKSTKEEIMDNADKFDDIFSNKDN